MLVKYLVTGCAGYLGSVLCYQLVAEGHSVVGVDKLLHGGRSIIPLLDHSRFRFVPSGIAETSAFADEVNESCTVVHLAAIVGDPASRRLPEETQATNVDGSRTLFRLCRDRGVRKLVFVSTCSNYGVVPQCQLATEETVLRPLSLYAESKVQIERELMAGILYDRNWTILRFATLYGLSPRPRFDLTVNDFTMKAITEGRLEVYLPRSSRPYLHVADAANAITFVAQSDTPTDGEVFNVGNTAENYQKAQIVEMIRAHIGDFVVEGVSHSHDVRDYRVSFEKIDRAGFVTRRTVSDGIVEIAEAVRSGMLKDLSSTEFVN